MVKPTFTISLLVGLLSVANTSSSAVLITDHPELTPHSLKRPGFVQGDAAMRGYSGGIKVGESHSGSPMTDMNGATSRVFETDNFQAAIVKGMGRDVTMEEALPMFVPANWDIQYQTPVSFRERVVTWRGGTPWTNILQEIMVQSNLYAFVDPSRKSVRISTSPYADVWEMFASDRSVQIALRRWAKIAGWQLVWEIDRDFSVESEVVMRGTFADAVQKLVVSLNASDYPIKAMFYEGSKTLRVIKYTEGERGIK